MNLAKVLLPAALALSACNGASLVQQGPSDTLRAYAAALEQGRVDDAYRLLSDEAKRSMPLDAFRRLVKENPHEVTEIAQALARPMSDPIVTTKVALSNGDELELFFEGGRWKIDASAVDLYGQSTPRQAILGFLRAFERKRYDVVLRYVPDADREGTPSAEGEAEPKVESPAPVPKPGDPPKAPAPKNAAPEAAKPASGPIQLTADKLREAWEGPEKEQINRKVQAIKTALPSAQIEEIGDVAQMSYGGGGTVAFVREHGAWKIKDF